MVHKEDLDSTIRHLKGFLSGVQNSKNAYALSDYSEHYSGILEQVRLIDPTVWSHLKGFHKEFNKAFETLARSVNSGRHNAMNQLDGATYKNTQSSVCA